MSIIIILNVIFGLFLAWTLLSLVAMQGQEWIASKLRWRSIMLEKAIGRMLTDPTLTDQFYNHPLIRSLYTGKNLSEKPSYIPSSEFTQTLVDLLADIGTEASLLQQQLYKLFAETAKLPHRKVAEARNRISLMLGMVRKALVSEAGEEAYSEILDNVKTDLLALGQDMPRLQVLVDKLFEAIRIQKQQINDALVKLSLKGKPSGDEKLDRIKAGMTALSITHPQLKQTLYAIINGMPKTAMQKNPEMDLIKSNIEEWFTNAMNRLTGWYKRRCMLTTLVIGILAATLFNVDSINLTTRLWREPDLRVAILQHVEEILTDEDTPLLDVNKLSTVQEQFADITLPIGWLGLPLKSEPPEAPAYNCNLTPAQENEVYGIKISSQCYPLINSPQVNDTTGWLVKLAGLLISGVAASPGASFWFDILKKMVNIRLSGIKPREGFSTATNTRTG